MKTTQKLNSLFFLLLLIIPFFSTSQNVEKKIKTSIPDFAPTPPMGYNSFQSYLTYMHEDNAHAIIDVMAEKYLPYGYEYFVIDDGWQVNQVLYEGTNFPKSSLGVAIDEYGLYEPCETYFPNGILPVAKHAHEKGLKFGLWIIRGIPRLAVEKNLPIYGTNYTARDIADTTSICIWKSQNYGVDMSKPGAQEYYNSLIDKLASWGVDFLKIDDIVEKPKEIMAIVRAIEDRGHKITVSLSPGDVHSKTYLPYYKRTNMIRISRDIWDSQLSIEKGFEYWEEYIGAEGNGFWLDLDMIPFGRLRVVVPDFLNRSEDRSSGQSRLSKHQMETFITQRALAASPLFVGGDLTTMDDFSYSLLTNKDMLACNKNGIMGVNVYRAGNIDVWFTSNKNDPSKGWIGIFNRNTVGRKVTLTKYDLGFKEFVNSYDVYENKNSFKLKDIWNNEVFTINDEHKFVLPSNGVVFLEFAEIPNSK